MEDFLNISFISGQPSSNFVPTFKRVTGLLNQHGIEYVIAGTLALGLYSKVRYSDEIDILCHVVVKPAITALLSESDCSIKEDTEFLTTFIPENAGVTVNFIYGNSRPQELAINDPAELIVFGSPTPIIRPRYLLWMYLIGTQHSRHQDKADGITLIEEGQVDISTLTELLKKDGTADVLLGLEEWLAHSARPKHKTYSDSVKARLLRLRGAQQEN